MTGEYQHSLDSKGRLFIPARLRDELGETFYLTVSDERCLWAYSAESWQAFVDKVRSMPYVDRKKMRPLLPSATWMHRVGRFCPRPCAILPDLPRT